MLSQWHHRFFSDTLNSPPARLPLAVKGWAARMDREPFACAALFTSNQVFTDRVNE
jgi:hypothetical protein